MRSPLKRSLTCVIGLAIPAALALLVLSEPTIRVLFEQGKFTASAAGLTSNVLVAYAIALPAAVTTEVLARGLIALRDIRTPLYANSAQLLGRALIMALLIGAAGRDRDPDRVRGDGVRRGPCARGGAPTTAPSS